MFIHITARVSFVRHMLPPNNNNSVLQHRTKVQWALFSLGECMCNYPIGTAANIVSDVYCHN